MSPILLIDGNNLGHVLGYIDKAAGRYDSAALLACLDGLARHLGAQGQEVEIVLFLDDVYAAERLEGWRVHVAPVPGGDADAAIRAYAQAHAGRPQILVSGDQALCGAAEMWGVVCLSPLAFVARHLVPARQAGFVDRAWPASYVEAGEEILPAAPTYHPPVQADGGELDRRRQAAALARAEAVLHGESLPAPDVYRLDLSRWTDEAELALYLAERHLCPAHADLTSPDAMIAAIRGHCSRQSRYFSAGRVIDRVFRLLLCRPEHTLSLGDLARLGKMRRRKVRAAIEKYGARLGIVATHSPAALW
jgi:hypothetical protein